MVEGASECPHRRRSHVCDRAPVLQTHTSAPQVARSPCLPRAVRAPPTAQARLPSPSEYYCPSPFSLRPARPSASQVPRSAPRSLVQAQAMLLTLLFSGGGDRKRPTLPARRGRSSRSLTCLTGLTERCFSIPRALVSQSATPLSFAASASISTSSNMDAASASPVSVSSYPTSMS